LANYMSDIDTLHVKYHPMVKHSQHLLTIIALIYVFFGGTGIYNVYILYECCDGCVYKLHSYMIIFIDIRPKSFNGVSLDNAS